MSDARNPGSDRGSLPGSGRIRAVLTASPENPAQHAIVRASITTNGGSLLATPPTRLVATFADDPPLAAVRAALAVRDAVPHARVGIALHTGPNDAGSETVEQARAALELALPGEVRVHATSTDALETWFDVKRDAHGIRVLREHGARSITLDRAEPRDPEPHAAAEQLAGIDAALDRHHADEASWLLDELDAALYEPASRLALCLREARLRDLEGRPDLAAESLGVALADAPQAPTTLRTEAVLRRAASLAHQGRAHDAREALAAVQPSDTPLAHTVYALAARALGEYEIALASFGTARERAAPLGALENSIQLAATLGRVGAYERAAELLEDTIDRAAHLDAEGQRAAALSHLGFVRARLGDPTEALALESQAVDAATRHGLVHVAGAARWFAARVHLERGLADDVATARALLDDAASALDPYPPWRAMLGGARAAASLAMGLADEAAATCAPAFLLLEKRDAMDVWDDFVRLTYVHALLGCGRTSEADAILRGAIDRLHAKASMFDNASARSRFLRAVPENAELLTLAQQRLGI